MPANSVNCGLLFLSGAVAVVWIGAGADSPVTAQFRPSQACRTRLLKLAANAGFASRTGESFKPVECDLSACRP